MTTGKKSLNIGLIGCGAIAEGFHLPALLGNPRTADGIVLVEMNEVRLAELHKKYPNAKTCTDYRELTEIDGVIVATPPNSHPQIVRHFVEQSTPVLCEKPLTNELWEAKELVELSKATKVPILVNQTRRFFPTYGKIKELIAAGTLGELRSITWHDGVDHDWPASSAFHFQPNAKGVLSDTGIHMLDTICFWLGAKPSLVESLSDAHGGPETMSTIRLKHNECDIELKLSRLGHLKNGFEIVGSKGKLEAATEEFCELFVETPEGKKTRHYCGSRKLTYVDFAKPLVQNFCEVIDGTAEPFVSAESVCDPIALVEEAYETSQRYQEPWNDYLQAGSIAPTSTSKTILVTGASGFLGNRIVESLAISNNAEPLALVRGWSRAARPSKYGVGVRVADLANEQQLKEALKGVDAVVHCAYTCDRDSIVGHTKNLLNATIKSGVDQFIYLSSAEVYGSEQEGTINEDSKLLATQDSYGDWKREAEEIVRASKVDSTILRPSIIYGPASASWSVDLAKRLQFGNWGIFDEVGNGYANLIYVDDLVKAILLCINNSNAIGQTFNVNGPSPGSWNDYFVAFNDAMKLPPLQKIGKSQSNLKTAFYGAIGSVTSTVKSMFEDKLMEIYLQGGPASRWMKWLKGELESTPSSGELNDLYSRKAIYEDSRIRSLVGYEPDFSLERGLNQTIAWLSHHEFAARGLYDPTLEQQPRNVEVMQ